MALSRVKTWTTESLASADLNAEFNNILNNALSLISPLTGNLAAGGNIITGLGAGDATDPSLSVTGATNTGIYFTTTSVLFTTAGTLRVTLDSNGITLADAHDIVVNTSTGTKIGTATTQKLGFWNVTPVVQPADADQADQGAMSSSAVGDLVATNGGWGYSTEANADAVHTAIDQLVADVAALDTLLTAMRTALVDTGIMKGAA